MKVIRINSTIDRMRPLLQPWPADLKDSAARIVATGLSAGMLFATAMICLGLWP